MSWRQSYLAFDDEALATLANTGLLRRAAKDVEGDRVQWQSGDDSSGTLLADGCIVRLDARGPAFAQCNCPAAGICKHKLAAALWVRAHALSAGPAASASPEASPALAEILALDQGAVFKAAGIAAVRVVHGWDELLVRVGESLAQEAKDRDARSLPPETPHFEVQPHKVQISIPQLQIDVQFLLGGGWPGMLSEAPANKRAALHLATLVAIWRAHGLAVSLPIEPDVQTQHDDDHILLMIDDLLHRLLSSGLSHLSETDVSHLQALSMHARSEALPGLAARLRSISAAVNALRAREDFIDEAQVLALLSELFAWCVGFRKHGVRDARRRFDESNTLDLWAIGADWWQRRSGARGLSLVFVDLGNARIVSAVPSRADASDPTFTRDAVWAWQPLWRGTATPEQVLRQGGGLRLHDPRISEDQRIGLSGETRGELLGAFAIDDARLANVGHRDWHSLTDALSKEINTDVGYFLLVPTSTDAPQLDAIRQELVWALFDAQGRQLRTRLSTDPNSVRRVHALQALLARAPIIYGVLVRAELEPDLCLRPVAILLNEAGKLRSISLEFSDEKAPRTALTGRILKMQQTRRAPAVEISLIERLCGAARQLIEFQAASGLMKLDTQQAELLNLHAGAIAAAGLETLAQALRQHCSAPSPASALRFFELLRFALRIEACDRLVRDATTSV